MSARDGLGELGDAPGSSERFADRVAGAAARGGALGPDGHGAVFIDAIDLKILSTALAQFIVDAGRRTRDEPERTEIIRAREMMDDVDDELYALSHAK